MTTTARTPLKTLDAEELSRIARQKSPCVTIQIPDVRPGAGAQHTLAAAVEGRVRCLFVAQGARVPASPAQADHDGLYPGEDLLNAAAVETLRTSGEVFAIPGEKASSGRPYCCSFAVLKKG